MLCLLNQTKVRVFYLLVILLSYSNLFATNYYTRTGATGGCYGATSWSNTSHSGAVGSSPPSIVAVGDTIFANDNKCTTYDPDPGGAGAGLSVGCDCSFGTSTINGVIIVRSGAIVSMPGAFVINGTLLIESTGILELSGSLTINSGASVIINGRVEVNGTTTNFEQVTGSGCLACATGGDYINVSGGSIFTNFDNSIPCDGTCLSTPLPVSFLQVYVEENTLYWSTASETNNDYFEILYSYDGIEYFSHGIVNGAGNSEKLLQYSYDVSSVLKGLTYFKVRQVDYSGDRDESKIVLSGNNTNKEPILASKGERKYQIYAQGDHLISAALYNAEGKIIAEYNEITSDTWEINLSSLPQTIYFLQVIGQDKSYSYKLR